MLLVLESRVHQDAQKFDMVFKHNRLSLNGKRLTVRFTCLGGKVHDSCLFSFPSRTASPLPVERFIDDCLNSFPVTLRG